MQGAGAADGAPRDEWDEATVREAMRRKRLVAEGMAEHAASLRVAAAAAPKAGPKATP